MGPRGPPQNIVAKNHSFVLCSFIHSFIHEILFSVADLKIRSADPGGLLRPFQRVHSRFSAVLLSLSAVAAPTSAPTCKPTSGRRAGANNCGWPCHPQHTVMGMELGPSVLPGLCPLTLPHPDPVPSSPSSISDLDVMHKGPTPSPQIQVLLKTAHTLLQ